MSSSNSFFSTIGSYLGAPVSEESKESENVVIVPADSAENEKKTRKRKGAAKDAASVPTEAQENIVIISEAPIATTPPEPKSRKQKKQPKSTTAEADSDGKHSSSLIIPLTTSSDNEITDEPANPAALSQISLPHKKKMKRNADIDQAKGNITVDATSAVILSSPTDSTDANAASTPTNTKSKRQNKASKAAAAASVAVDSESNPVIINAVIPEESKAQEKPNKRSKKQKDAAVVEAPPTVTAATDEVEPAPVTDVVTEPVPTTTSSSATDTTTKSKKKGGRKPKQTAESNETTAATEPVETDSTHALVVLAAAENTSTEGTTTDVVITTTNIDGTTTTDTNPNIEMPAVTSDETAATASADQTITALDLDVDLQAVPTDGSQVKTKKKRDLPNHTWQRSYEALLEYGSRHNGDCNIPQAEEFDCYLPIDENEPIVPSNPLTSTGAYHYVGKLGKWLDNQRTARKQAMLHGADVKHRVLEDGTKIFRTPLLPDREGLLQKLVDDGKLSWDNSMKQVAMIYKTEGEIIWKRHFAALNHYYDTYGHCNIAQRQVYECELPGLGPNGSTYPYKAHLGIWLDNQRNAKKGTVRKV